MSLCGKVERQQTKYEQTKYELQWLFFVSYLLMLICRHNRHCRHTWPGDQPVKTSTAAVRSHFNHVECVPAVLAGSECCFLANVRGCGGCAHAGMGCPVGWEWW